MKRKPSARRPARDRKSLLVRVDTDVADWFAGQAAKREVTRNKIIVGWAKALMRAVQALEADPDREPMELDELLNGFGRMLANRAARLVDLSGPVKRRVISKEDAADFLQSVED